MSIPLPYPSETQLIKIEDTDLELPIQQVTTNTNTNTATTGFYVKDRDLFGFESSLQTVLDMHRELRDITKQQQPQITQLESTTESIKETIEKAEKDISKSNEYNNTNRRWNIVSGATAGVLLTGVIAGPQIAIPLALVSSAVGYYMFRK
jgi:hypothetical protein